jgi:hypothetical protein
MGEDGYALSVGVIGADGACGPLGKSTRRFGTVGNGDVGAGKDGGSLGLLTVLRLTYKVLMGCVDNRQGPRTSAFWAGPQFATLRKMCHL